MIYKKIHAFLLTFTFLVGTQPILNYASENTPLIPSAAEQVLQRKDNLKLLQEELKKTFTIKTTLETIGSILGVGMTAGVLFLGYYWLKSYFSRQQRTLQIQLETLDEGISYLQNILDLMDQVQLQIPRINLAEHHRQQIDELEERRLTLHLEVGELKQHLQSLRQKPITPDQINTLKLLINTYGEQIQALRIQQQNMINEHIQFILERQEREIQVEQGQEREQESR